MMLRAVAMVVVLGGVLVACSADAQQQAPQGAAERHDATGVVRSVDDAHASVVIAHDDIPGVMPAMTMPFSVPDAAVRAKLQPGARVRFVLQQGAGGRYEIVDATVL